MTPDRLTVESLSRTFHALYQEEIRRQGQVVRHADNYNDLSENTKELDRVLARYFLSILEPLEAQARRYETALKEIDVLLVKDCRLRIIRAVVLKALAGQEGNEK